MKLLRFCYFYGWLLAIASPLHAAPMGFNIAIEFDNPITLFGLTIDRMDGMMFGDPVPEAGPNVLDCFLDICEIDSLMLDITNGGITQATLDLSLDTPLNPLGQLSGTLAGGFGSFDVVLLTDDFAYEIVGGECTDFSEVICQGQDIFFTLLNDLTDDGATLDDIPVLNIVLGSAVDQSGVATPIASITSQMLELCPPTGPCGNIDIDPKTVPEPGVVALLAFGLMGVGVRRRNR